MCGITGLYIDKDATFDTAALNVRRLRFNESLIRTMARGPHATGVMAIGPTSIEVLKLPLDAVEFIDTPEYDRFMKALEPMEAYAIVGHTRFATHGSPMVSDNNHPLEGTCVTGVHNGIVNNHLQLKAKYGDYAEVDSAALVALLDSKVGEALYKERHLKAIEAWQEPSGHNAMVWAHNDDDTRLFVARKGNPLVMTMPTDGELWLNSTIAGLPKNVRATAQSLPDRRVVTIGQPIFKQLKTGYKRYAIDKETKAKAKSKAQLKAEFGKVPGANIGPIDQPRTTCKVRFLRNSTMFKTTPGDILEVTTYTAMRLVEDGYATMSLESYSDLQGSFDFVD